MSMTTIGESISRIRNVFKASNEDAFITDRFIYSMITKFAKALIRRQDSESKLMQYDSLFETLHYVELIEVDTIEAGCAGITTGCKIMRTKDVLPKIFTGSMGPIFRSVTSIDESVRANQITPGIYVSMNKSSNFKYNKFVYFWYKNGYLYLPKVEWEAISVEAIWDGPVTGYCGTEKKGCALIREQQFNIPEYLFAEIEGMVEKEFMQMAQVPSDNSDNSQNILR